MANFTRFDSLTEIVPLRSAMDRLFEAEEVKPRQIRIDASSASAVDETSAS